LYRPAQLPNGDALHDQAIRDDQSRRLRWRQKVKPGHGGDDAKGKPRYTRHQRSGKSTGCK